MRHQTSLRRAAWCLACLLLVARAASADVDFPIEIDAIEGTLPPQSVVRRMCGAAEVVTGAVTDAGLTVVFSQNDMVRFRDKQGKEFLVHLVLTFPESVQQGSTPSTYWGFVHAQLFDEAGGNLTSDQARQYEPIVQRVADAWVARMEATLSGFAAEPINRRLQRSRLSLNLNAKQAADTKAQIEDLRAQLSNSNSLGSLPISSIEARLSESITHLKQFDLELIGLHARNEALEKHISEVAEETDEKLRLNHAIADDLSKKLQLLAQEEGLLRKKVAAGEAEQSQIDAIHFQVTVTANELNNIRQASGGGDVDAHLSKLRASLTDTSIEIAECEAKRRFVLEQAKEREVLLRDSQQAQPLRDKLVMLQHQLDTLESQSFELSRNAILAEAESRPVRVRKLVPEPAGDKAEE
jgi:hypothetical protein